MDSILLHTKFTLHQRTYTYDTIVAASYLGLSPESWGWAAWVHKALKTKSARALKSETDMIMRAFVLTKGNEEARALINLPLEVLSWTAVCRFYDLLEIEIAAGTATMSAVSKHYMSSRTRGFLNRFLEEADFESVHRVRSAFRTALKLPTGGRALISDEPTIIGGDELEPLGAIAHSNIEDLRKRTSQILTKPLEQIAAACSEQLDSHDALHRLKAEMLKTKPDRGLIEELASITNKNRSSPSAVAWAKSIPIDKLTIAYVHLIDRCISEADTAAPSTILRSKEIDAFITQSLGIKALGSRLVLPIPNGGQNLLACLLVLQIHSHWNVNSVLELSLRSLSAIEPPLIMQSYKSRPDVSTPIVSIERGDPAARALQFLIDRLELLKKMKWVKETENRLWLSRKGKPIVGWGSILRPFREKWGLPRFSFEQIRTQVTAAQSVQVGGLAIAKSSAGHASLGTTSTYVDKLLTRRFNSSANLEFQRRLEADVRTMAEGGDARYLYPIGDGSSCTDPYAPPFESDMHGETCMAQRCHAGDGCSNRRIVLDNDRVEEVVRTSKYYRDNWVRLYEKNPTAFEMFHVPSMNFNFAMLGMLRGGSYAHVVRAAEAAISAGEENFNG